ncbi:MAG: SDR family NAD(P)-dependent oxidoreductase, partial [Geminicoccaceae bacterium]
IVNFTRALACEWAPSGVRVNAVAPTFARTRLTEPLLADADMERQLLRDTPMGRFALPEEVAAHRVAEEIGPAESHRLDVADEDEAKAVVAAVAAKHGRIDILINNAGLGARMPIVEMPTERWRQVLAVNVDGAFFCARETGRHMLGAGRGAVVNVASIMGLVGGAHYPNLAYHTAKGAIVNFTRALACEWAASGVRVNAVAPTFARTRLTEPLLADEAMAARLMQDTPMGRFVEPEEVAAAALFLASDAASMITGVTLPVDGGWTAR